MLLDHSVFAGMADIHDRHRDMRLDVDNMSYEVRFENASFFFFFSIPNLLSFPFKVMFLIQFLPGIIGPGGAHRKRMHWS